VYKKSKSLVCGHGFCFRATLELALSRGRNVMAIWQDLVDNCGFTAGYQRI